MKNVLIQAPVKRQRGMTTIGIVILVAFIGIFAFAGLRLTPVYLNYTKVVGVIEGINTEFDGQAASRAAIRNSIMRRFDVESVGVITARDVEINAVDGGFEVVAKYQHSAAFIANISFLVDFEKSTKVRR